MLIANAVLDLVDVPAVLPGLLRLLVPGGVYWFTINYDGESIFAPGHPHDDRVMRAYHRDMDERSATAGRGKPNGPPPVSPPAGCAGARAGGGVVGLGRAPGPDGNYPADEAYFLRSILSTIRNALRDRQDWVEPADLADWLAVRGQQLAAGELVYIAHQLDFVGRSPG